MTIRLRILLACLGLTLITVGLGAYSQLAQQQLGGVASQIYDDTVLAISYLRAAQNGLGQVEQQWLRHAVDDGAIVPDHSADLLAEVAADLAVARERAMSQPGRAATDRVAQQLNTLQANLEDADLRVVMAAMDEIQAGFATAVETYSADGFRYRRSVDDLVLQSARRTSWAVAFAVAAAIAITVMLSRSILPALRTAVGIAQSIAAGRLDNVITPRGNNETALLMRALAAMQSGIANSLAQIQDLMEQQKSNHAGELAIQHATLEAALDNMVQGLCLFSAENRLTMTNRRFTEMFGTPTLGALYDAMLPDPVVAPMLAPLLAPMLAQVNARMANSFSYRLEDGRTIFVNHQPVTSGGWVATFEDVTERHEADAKLAYMARHDILTSLPNRLQLNEHTNVALSRSRRTGGLAVLLLDLDRFKAVNDSLGHHAGDTLLQAVAERLRQCTRDTDLVARLGSDEFAIVQETAQQPGDATALATRLIEVLSAPFDLNGQQIMVGASVGIAISDAEDTTDLMLKQADLALHRAKAEGRNTFRLFAAGMDAEVKARRELEVDLRMAMQRRELEVFYQPVVTAGVGINGFEALMRWRHPLKGLISPAIFIPLAEELGLIGAMGRWILGQATADAAAWPGHLKVAVNLSPVQFRDGTVDRQVQEALLESGLPAGRLELEITESVLFEAENGALETLQRLRGMGVRIAMDDFGTGYSSLSYLRRFPFDKIKIDQSFVRGMSESADCTAIIRAVIGLGRSLGMTVNAEGVETPEQLAALQNEGCGEMQGYLFSKPVPIEAVPGLLLQHGNATLPAAPAPPHTAARAA